MMLSLAAMASVAVFYPAVAADAPTTAAAQAEVSPDYRIGPGDTLKVSVFHNDELTATLPVRPDGKISTPLVEDMVAVGKTPSQLARDIEKSLAVYIKSPKVSVVVTVALSVYSQVKIIGQVKTPESLPFREGMTVIDAVLAAGGPTALADDQDAVRAMIRLIRLNLAELPTPPVPPRALPLLVTALFNCNAPPTPSSRPMLTMLFLDVSIARVPPVASIVPLVSFLSVISPLPSSA